MYVVIPFVCMYMSLPLPETVIMTRNQGFCLNYKVSQDQEDNVTTVISSGLLLNCLISSTASSQVS